MNRTKRPMSRNATAGYAMRNVSALMKVLAFGLCLTFVLAVAPNSARGDESKAFASPEEAASALVDAVRKEDRDGVLAILGSESEEWIVSGDPIQDKQDVERFIAAYDQKNGIEKEGDGMADLVVGDDNFPFPFPIVKTAKGWTFDPELGKEELLNRRIGRNELSTIQVLLAVSDAQFDYASVDRNGDGTLEYAEYIISSEGQRNGLYWPIKEGQPLSPLGPLVADAVREGYGEDATDEEVEPETTEAEAGTAQAAEKAGEGSEETVGDADDEPQPYHGYHFRLLTKQSANAPGDAQNYIVNGKMIGGFAVLAYPATYGNSGVMTFMINHEGMIYDADFGPDTEDIVDSIDSFDPGEGWEKVEVDQ